MNELRRLLTKTRAAADQRAAAADQEYRALVTRCAKGVEIPPEKIIAQLEKLGHDVVQFQSDVEALALRMDLATEAATLENLSAELGGVRGRIAEAERKYTTALQELDLQHSLTIDPLWTTERQLSLEIASAEDARRKLATSAPADRVAVRDQLLRERNDTAVQLQQVKDNLDGIRERLIPQLKGQLERWEKSGHGQPHGRRSREHVLHPDAARAERQIQEELKEIARIQGQLDEANDVLRNGSETIARHQRVVDDLSAQLAQAESDLLLP